MATVNLTWAPCGSSSDGQFLYYGKTTIVTGTPISGTGWSLYTGAALPNTVGSASITGLDDNVEYSFSIYCHCTSSGNGPLSNSGPLIKYVCPTVQTTPTFNGVNFTINVPSSANNTGSWIQAIIANVTDGSNNTVISQTFNSPFTSTINFAFSGLNPSTNYNLNILYSNTTGTRTNSCISTPFTTAAACVAPTINISNITSNSFDVSWTPTTGGSFDILVNSNVVASGLTPSSGIFTVSGLTPATPYQVTVRKNCTTGGTAISNAQNVTTSNSLVTGLVSMIIPQPYSSGQQAITLGFTFPTPTPVPLTLYFGYTWQNSCNSCPGSMCSWSNGYDIFTPPAGAQNCPTGPDTYTGPAHLPFVVNVPQGSTSFSATNIFTTIGNPGPSGGVIGPWLALNPNPSGGSARGYTDLYVRVNTPAGYSSNLAYSNSANITNVTVHNV